MTDDDDDGVFEVRRRSPRIMASDCITVRPPRMMFVVPWIWERRETLLPASVSMYSPFAALGGIFFFFFLFFFFFFFPFYSGLTRLLSL